MHISEQTIKAAIDIKDGVGKWRLWLLIGWQEVRQRYRRSTLGPLWITLTTGITISAMGLIWGQLFGMNMAEYLPYITLGWLSWGLISAIIVDGANCFISSQGFISQMRQPLSLYTILPIWRSLIVFFHNIIVFLFVAIIYQLPPTPYTALIFITFPLVVLSLSWVPMFLGILSARFRDVPVITQSFMTVAFFLTPVIWPTSRLGSFESFVYLNPLASYLEMIRLPLLGQMPSMTAWMITIGLAVAGWGITFPLYVRTRIRIPYWL